MAKIDIFFGSQSGTAECFAEELCEECVANGFQAEVIDLAKFEPEDFASRKLVIVVISTYGEGEPPDNAHAFHRWVSDPRHGGALKGQRFCVMGLGDMNYSLFNNMGLVTDASLERLGGKRIYQRGVGDDCQDIYEHFTAWRKGGLWDALKKAVAEVNLDLADDVSNGISVPQVPDGSSDDGAPRSAKRLKVVGTSSPLFFPLFLLFISFSSSLGLSLLSLFSFSEDHGGWSHTPSTQTTAEIQANDLIARCQTLRVV